MRGALQEFSFPIIVDGKRALSGAEKGKEIGQSARQAPHSPPVMPGSEAVIRSALEPHFGLAFWQRGEKLVLALVWVAHLTKRIVEVGPAVAHQAARGNHQSPFVDTNVS